MGESLGAYAQPCVSGEIKRHFRDKRWQIRVKRPVQELRLAVRAAAAELTQQLARVPSDAELAAWLEVTEAEVTEARAADQAFQAFSLDAPLGDDQSRTLAELMGAEDPSSSRPSRWKPSAHWAELPHLDTTPSKRPPRTDSGPRRLSGQVPPNDPEA